MCLPRQLNQVQGNELRLGGSRRVVERSTTFPITFPLGSAQSVGTIDIYVARG